MALKVNGETIVLAESVSQREDTTFSYEIEGQDTAELRLAELDQTDPAGRYRIRLTGDQLRVERATMANWANQRTLLSFDDDGIDSIRLDDDGMADFLEQWLLHMQNGGGVGLLSKVVVETALLM